MEMVCKMSESTTKNHLKNETEGYEYAIVLVERAVETKEKIKKQKEEERSRKVSRIDVIVLIEELKNDFKRINELSRDIAKKNGRTIVTYEDAEEAIRAIKAEKSL